MSKHNISNKDQQDLLSSNPEVKVTAMKKALQLMRQQYNANLAEHLVAQEFMKERLLGKLCLVGVMGQGISASYVTDIRSDTPGVCAVALSTDKNAGEDGMYFDARQLTFFYVYNEEEAKRQEERFAKLQAMKPAYNPVIKEGEKTLTLPTQPAS